MMDEHVTARRAGAATWLMRVVSRRYVLAWGLSLAGASLHPTLAPGADPDWQMWMMMVLAISAGLLGLWWAEPYLWYRYRRRRFRRLLVAEGGWRPWTVHTPLRPWRPGKRGRRRAIRAVLSSLRPGGARPPRRPVQRHEPRPAPASEPLSTPAPPG